MDSVTSIDLERLRDMGIIALLIDLDNTLVPWRSTEVASEIGEWILRAKEQGFSFCIVSNTRTWKRLEHLASELQVPFVRRGLKPRRHGFRAALKLLQVEPSNAAVVGDQIFTDILGGNRLRLYTILVRPLERREFFGTRISRILENIVLKFLQSHSGDHRTRR